VAKFPTLYEEHANIISWDSAGVIGLQSAIDLLKAGHRVTIVAAHLPGDKVIEYTSPWAGAHWRTHASDDDHEEQQWDLETYEDWMRTIERENQDSKLPKSGLAVRLSAPSSTDD